ncbi:ATP-binding cassette domain-containing protein [Lentisphaerota bacterium ZTH]|nr:ATP-binding cassette domain-containing protein [Lentisphaerota bacterium]WET06388.1 ATP-binding cassette domain-containing protein [Lentisphaerota bacterium ZTH]
MKPVIALKKVSLQRGEQLILKDADLEVQTGSKLVIKGPSGCGKSSLLAALAGCYPPSSGAIFISGTQISRHNAAALRRDIAFIGQEPVTGAENVREALLLPFNFKANRALRVTEQEIIGVLERLQLQPDILSKECRHISGGEKQRIVIARALLLKKKIFLADEPTTGLDLDSSHAVIETLSDPEFTVVSASHDEHYLSHQQQVYVFKDYCLKAANEVM